MTVSELRNALENWDLAGFGDLKVRISKAIPLVEGTALTYHDVDDIRTYIKDGFLFIAEPEQKIKPETHVHYI